MSLKFETSVDYLLFFIIFIKIVFVVAAVGHLLLTHMPSNVSNYVSNKASKNIDNKLVYWKERTEFIFIVSMSILLIYHFRPNNKPISIDKETALLFFLFGWILIITAKWNIFFSEARWFQLISKNIN